MDAFSYVLGGLIIYLSTVVGIWIARAYRGEVDQYERIIGYLTQLVFITLWGVVGWSITGNFLVAGVLFASAVIGSIFIRLEKHIVFTTLSAAYILVAVYSTEPFTAAGLLFVFGALSTMLVSRDRDVKRVLMRRLGFFILVLFGYLLSFVF